MAETIYHPEVRCEVSPDGFLPNGITVEIRDEDGRSQFLQVTATLVNRYGDADYLPVGIVKIERGRRRVLIEFPTEADSGANRMWVSFDDLRKESPSQSGALA